MAIGIINSRGLEMWLRSTPLPYQDLGKVSRHSAGLTQKTAKEEVIGGEVC